ncbi:MAG: HAD-IA family hydrolase [Actinomycetota bacterium]|nr:HAD-IA family hydrolase [Actinomycetota bacterium]
MPRRILAVLLDFGDTLADEGTARADATGFTYDIELVEGARELLVELRRRGYRVALVADGRSDDSALLRARHDLDALLDAVVVSDEVGATKPDRRPYEVALARLGLSTQDAARVVMVGNRLERDVRGANARGFVSVWIDWSPRYRTAPVGPEERPRHVIRRPLELLDVLERLEG